MAALAPGEGVRVLLVDGPVSRPARGAEPVIRAGVVGARGLLQVLQVPDGTDVVEPAVLTERDAGRVVAAVLETLEPAQKQLLRGPTADVSDDPAHASPLPETAKPGCVSAPASGRSPEPPPPEPRDPSTEAARPGPVARLPQPPTPRLGP